MFPQTHQISSKPLEKDIERCLKSYFLVQSESNEIIRNWTRRMIRNLVDWERKFDEKCQAINVKGLSCLNNPKEYYKRKQQDILTKLKKLIDQFDHEGSQNCDQRSNNPEIATSTEIDYESFSNLEDNGEKSTKQKFSPSIKKIFHLWSRHREMAPRAGVIFVYKNGDGPAEVLITMYRKGNTENFGFPKGKQRYFESIRDTAIREAAEEAGFIRGFIAEHLVETSFIRRHVYYNKNVSIMHHYYIVRVQSKPRRLNPQKNEINSLTWRSIESLPLRNPSNQKNYFMVNCMEANGSRSLLDDLRHFIN